MGGTSASCKVRAHDLGDTRNAPIKHICTTGLCLFHRLTNLELEFGDADIRATAGALCRISSTSIKTVCLVHHCKQADLNVPELYAILGVDAILAKPPYTFLERVTLRLFSNEPKAQVWLAGLPRAFPCQAKRNILLCEWRFESHLCVVPFVKAPPKIT